MKIKGFKLGATGHFPRGHADADDQGELRLALAADYRNAMVRLVTPSATRRSHPSEMSQQIRQRRKQARMPKIQQ